MCIDIKQDPAYACAMVGFFTKAEIRDAYSEAQKRTPGTIISEETGIPTSKLYDFGSKGVLNYEDTRRLELWLEQKGYLGPQESDFGAELIGASDPDLEPIARELIEGFILLTRALKATRVVLPSRLALVSSYLVTIQQRIAEECKPEQRSKGA